MKDGSGKPAAKRCQRFGARTCNGQPDPGRQAEQEERGHARLEKNLQSGRIFAVLIVALQGEVKKFKKHTEFVIINS